MIHNVIELRSLFFGTRAYMVIVTAIWLVESDDLASVGSILGVVGIVLVVLDENFHF